MDGIDWKSWGMVDSLDICSIVELRFVVLQASHGFARISVVSVLLALEIEFLGRLPSKVPSSTAWTANCSNVVGVSAHCCGGVGLRLGGAISAGVLFLESSEAAVRAAQNANKLSGRCLAVKVPRQNLTTPSYLM